mgnify:CR=1 FL=1
MSKPSPLFVFALEQEARGLFDEELCLFTSVGKVNAAISLMKYLAENGAPELIINLGTAGSAIHKAGIVVHATRFIQRDMDVTPLGFAPFQTPFSDIPPIILPPGPETTLPQSVCGTGDHFDIAHTGEAYDTVDMEAYALARVCMESNLPFLCLKYISDGADGEAAQDWDAALDAGAKALRSAIDDYLA